MARRCQVEAIFFGSDIEIASQRGRTTSRCKKSYMANLMCSVNKDDMFPLEEEHKGVIVWMLIVKC